ncbi:HYPOXIA-INDUCBILE protein 1 HIG1 -RELATED [Salix koriyanagi]|uniref:HYPOXIA-INDUCBILE protein 1 HIG1 -RELATED n=1 Tax=Salix koriyanagi TaxID=2511006 RepID=A0A9Q0SSS9_9ROSI|nr:HYPOXIA-INDUCBILE protein 1 HIG1 -RELATED [Salix koriyanagi]
MGTAEPNFEQLFEEKKRARNPLVPIGALVTAGVLTAGLISFRRGNSQLGQVLMRARVVVQGATVALMVGTAFYYGDNPWKKPKLAHDEILRSVNMDVVRIFV